MKRGTIRKWTALLVCAGLVLCSAGCGYETASGAGALAALGAPLSGTVTEGAISRTYDEEDASVSGNQGAVNDGKLNVSDVSAGNTASSVRTMLYTDETSSGEWSCVNGEYSDSDTAGNSTYKISLSPGSSMTRVLGVLKTGEFRIEYETYNSGGANSFLLLNSNEDAIINVGGATSGNMNIMPENKTSGKVSQWVALLKDTWVKTVIVVDLDKSNAEGVLDFDLEVYRTDAYDGENTQWTLVGTFDENAYIAPGGGSNGANKAQPHENGAATDGLESFNIAAVKVVNDKGKTVYYDNIAVEAEGMQAVRSLESTEMTGTPARTEYPVGAGADLTGITVKGIYRYDYPDGSTEYLETEITDYEVLYDFSRPGTDIPVTIRVTDGDRVFEHVFYVEVYGLNHASYIRLQYEDEETLDGILLSESSLAAVHSGPIDALDVSNETNKIQISKGTAQINFGEVISDGTLHFETEFLTQATSGASLFLRLVNSENLPLIDIGQYGSSNLNLYLDRRTSGDTAGQFKNFPVRKWAKVSVDIDLDASKEQEHLVFTAVVWVTDNQKEGSWTEFARFDESIYLDSPASVSTTGAASTVLTMFDVAGIELCNAGASQNYYDNLFLEGVGAETTKVLTELKVVSLPYKTDYSVGDPFDGRGLELKGTYTYTFSDGTKETVERAVNSYEVDFDSSSPSECAPVTIWAEGKSVQFTVTIQDNPALEGIARYLVEYADNGLVTLKDDSTISLNKRNLKLPSCIGGDDLSYSTTSEGAAVRNNILSVTPRTDGKSFVKLAVTLKTKNSEGAMVDLTTSVLFEVEQADTDEIPTGTLVSEDDFKNAVRTLIDNGVISGQDRLTSAEAVLKQLDGPIRTEEFVSMLVHAFGVDTSFTDTVINRSDLDYNAWYAEDIIAAFQLSVEPRFSREGKAEYGIGDDLSKEDADDMIGRMKAVDQTDKGGVQYEQGLPAQVDSGEWLVDVKQPMSELPAFPGAEGYAKYITGGRGGKVIHVTNLNSSGEGSLLAALDNNGNRSQPRVIVFDVSGTIDWTKDTTIGNYKMMEFENVTIAGQTAPGGGITLINGNFYFAHSNNMIIRFISFRHGQDTTKDDSCYIENSNNIMIDHCSFSYGSDESMSSRYNSNLTIQWSIIADGVRTHSMGGLQEWSSESMLHCLLANQNDRNPKAKGIMDFVNNVLYNWGADGYVAGGNSGGSCWGNLIGNYFIAGLDTKSPYTPVCRSNGKYMLYSAGNLVDSNKNGMLDGVNTGIDMIRNDGGNYPERFTFEDLPLVLLMNRMHMSKQDQIDSAEDAYHKVMTYVGASVYGNYDGTTVLSHSDVDGQIINGVIHQTGKILLDNAESRDNEGQSFDKEYFNSYPSQDINDVNSPYYDARKDTDQDGMPDAWEKARGLDPENPNDHNLTAPSGYTWLEEYLNELAAPAFPCDDQEAPEKVLTYDTERTYELAFDYGEKTDVYNLYQTQNNLMVPLAPVLEYLGYVVTQADNEGVSAQYLYPVDNPMNLDTASGIHTVTPGMDKFTFSSTWKDFNDKAAVYNGMIYVPVSMVSLALGGIYEQEITDPARNLSVLTIHDAEVYKNWYEGSAVRNTRKVSAPMVSAVVTQEELRLLFDKEAAVADRDALAVVTDAAGISYRAEIGEAAVWGSNKVMALAWKKFVSDKGEALQWDQDAEYTIVIESGAFADFYNSSLITSEIRSSIGTGDDSVSDSAAIQVKTTSVPEYQAPARDLNVRYAPTAGVTENGPASGESLKVREAVKLIYELLPYVNVNKTNYDIIDSGQASRAGLRTVVGRAEALKLSDYTKESAEALEEALAAAKEVLADEDAGTEELDRAKEILLDAIRGLVKKGTEKPQKVDKTLLQEVIRRAGSFKPDGYTQESWAAFQNALTRAQAVMDQKDAAQSEVDDVREELQQAMHSLIKEQEPDVPQEADKSKLQAAVELAGALNMADYTQESAEVLKRALEEAREILGRQDAAQEEVDRARTALEQAMESLVKVPEEGGNSGDDDTPSGDSGNSGDDDTPAGEGGNSGDDDTPSEGGNSGENNPSSEDGNPPEVSAPQTGDINASAGLWAAALFLSLLAAGLCVLGFRKRDRRE